MIDPVVDNSLQLTKFHVIRLPGSDESLERSRTSPSTSQ